MCSGCLERNAEYLERSRAKAKGEEPPPKLPRVEVLAANRAEDEAAAKNDDFYKSVNYRKLLAEPTDAAGFFAEHDILQLKNLEQLWPESLRGKTIADVGCAAAACTSGLCCATAGGAAVARRAVTLRAAKI